MFRLITILMISFLLICGCNETRIIVQFKPDAITSDQLNENYLQNKVPKYTLSKVDRVIGDSAVSNLRQMQYLNGNAPGEEIEKESGLLSRLVILKFKNINDKQKTEIINKLNQDPSVEFAEQDSLIKAEAIPNDTYIGSQYSLSNINAYDMWDIKNSASDVTVAIVDSGINFDHPDLKNNIVDGYDFVNNDSVPEDSLGHGTMVAGVIAAVGNNGIGISGVAWRTKIMPLKFLENDGAGYISNAEKCISYAIDRGVKIINCSWTVNGEGPRSLKNLMGCAANAGVIFTVAAGNYSSDNDSTPSYPSNYSNPYIISVAASNKLDLLSDFSNYGKSSVHLTAPGTSIFTTNNSGGYSSASGTSLAAPHVAGTLALLKSLYPNWPAYRLKLAITTGVDENPFLKNKVISGGRLNCYKALTYDPNITWNHLLEIAEQLAYFLWQN